MKTPTAVVETAPAPVPDVDWDYLRRVAYASCRHIPRWVQRDDLIQEANLAAWQAAGRWREDGGSSFVRFVTERAVGGVRDSLRNHQPSSRSGKARLVFVPLDEHHDPPATDRDTVLDIDLRTTLDQALDRLTPRQRHVVVERFLHGRTNSDVGRELGITESAVSVMGTRALKRLQQDVYLQDWVGLAA